MMKEDEILSVVIDQDSRLLIKPKTKTFPLIYREAMEVHWDRKGKYLYSPKPRKWSYLDWYAHILKAAKEQGCLLKISDETEWVNIPEKLKNEIRQFENKA